MLEARSTDLVTRRYLHVYGAQVRAFYSETMAVSREGNPRAVLGYRRAGAEKLFLERYLDAPVETCVSQALGRPMPRESVIEIGSLAADDAFAMVALWASAANDLGGSCEVAVATLTAPLRRMFTRIGVPLHVLAAATLERVGDTGEWGSYYESEPMVCAGLIAPGQQAITTYLASRRRIAA